MTKISELPTTAFPNLQHMVPASYNLETHGLTIQQIRDLLAYQASEIGYNASDVGTALGSLDNLKADLTYVDSALQGKADTAHTHAIADVTGLQLALDGKVGNARTIVSGTGIAGGGDLSVDRTLTLEGRALALHQLASLGFIVQSSAGAYVSRAIAGGPGITVSDGAGAAGNPVINLGTPGTLSHGSANATTSTSHTHNIDGATSRLQMADSPFASVGTIVFMRRSSTGTGLDRGAVYAGSVLEYAGMRQSGGTLNGAGVGTNPSGSWMSLAHSIAVSGEQSYALMIRVS